MSQQMIDASTVHITTLRVTGIGCGGCAMQITRALEAISGVVHVDVHRRRTEVAIEHLPAFVDAAAIADAVRALGYGADIHATVPDLATEEDSSGARCCCAEPRRTTAWLNLGTSTIG